MANLSPNEKLLKQFKTEQIGWETFAKQYEKEIFTDAALDTHDPRNKNHGQKFTLRLLQTLSSSRRSSSFVPVAKRPNTAIVIS